MQYTSNRYSDCHWSHRQVPFILQAYRSYQIFSTQTSVVHGFGFG